ncbi:DegT/DnrJ/EryC1/StrS family aminotransferase [Rhodoferax sp.]|uniref:DegT/DnrJ/EryC1/StrS family aminotransferase n=1 Tax=Rhodoferax sp. TaxID=50421 RepID=UPI002731A5F4|nr:DegT/DnrJ/EryC1/StrS family aminotransferase [Rhodoferax sp.]MDP2440559.1 DegT/DnrJ/EryC1/StrS family aminotransferase [Rhodoferax sp.]MDZ4208664.1 DegT/DnrJ/EryC1/StrS family aminotransferase [Rhodoferax sp.]
MSDIRLIKPYLSFDEVETEFRDVFETGMFTRGKHVDAFRQELTAYTGAKHAFLTTSATTALWTCMKLLGIKADDEVIVSDFSWPATANVVEDLGARPVFADVSLDTFNMLPADLEKKITARTKAVIFVDALGNPTGLSEIKKICERHGLPLVEDAACAIGSSEFGRRCGSIADITCFSFHPRKLINTGEGGAILTDRDDWAKWLEIKLGAGVSGMKGPGADFVDFGYNFRLPEMAALMGRKQLAKLESIVDERNEIRAMYVAALEPRGYAVQASGHEVRHNIQSLVFRVPVGSDRNAMIRELKAVGIESTIGTYALGSTTYYRNKYHQAPSNSECLFETALTLPCYRGVDVQRVVQAMATIELHQL